MDRRAYPTRKLRLGDPEGDHVAASSASERVMMVWQLTLQAWIRPTSQNARRAWAALERFGAPLNDLKPAECAADMCDIW